MRGDKKFNLSSSNFKTFLWHIKVNMLVNLKSDTNYKSFLESIQFQEVA